MSSISLSGYVYYVSFINDFSRNAWIYFLKGKNDVFTKIKEYKSFIDNHTKRNIKTLWSDSGREVTYEESKGLCRESRIKRELVTPYNPQKNGIVE